MAVHVPMNDALARQLDALPGRAPARKTRKKRSRGEETFALQCQQTGLPAPVREYRWGAAQAGGPGKGLRARLDQAGLKDWRVDFAWPDAGVFVEIEGGVFVQGRHSRGAGMEADCDKYNAMTLSGGLLLRYTTGQVKSGQALRGARQALRMRGAL